MAQYSIQQIKIAVAEYYGIALEDMASQRRARSVARPRQIAMYIVRQITKCSFPKIAASFGKEDHTTVIHAVRTIEHLRKTDSRMDSFITGLGA